MFIWLTPCCPQLHVSIVMCCSVLQCVAMCCSVLQCVAVCCNIGSIDLCWSFLQYSFIYCSVSQYSFTFVALCCSTHPDLLQCVAVLIHIWTVCCSTHSSVTECSCTHSHSFLRDALLIYIFCSVLQHPFIWVAVCRSIYSSVRPQQFTWLLCCHTWAFLDSFMITRNSFATHLSFFLGGWIPNLIHHHMPHSWLIRNSFVTHLSFFLGLGYPT